MTTADLLAVPYDQRMEALGKANRIRLYRVQVTRELFRKERKITRELLDDPDLQNMQIWDLVSAQHRWGGQRTGRLLGRLYISGTRKLKEITPRQKDILADAIRRVNE